MSFKNYKEKMATAQRAINLTFKNWRPEHADVPAGSIGTYMCCGDRCGRTKHLVLFHGEYLLQHLVCDCGHIVCENCHTDVVKFDTNRELRAEPLKVPLFGTEEPPYFSLCPNCGLTCRATAKKSSGFLTARGMYLTFKPWGSLCDNCGCNVTSKWPRVSLTASPFGLPASEAPRTPSVLGAMKTTLRDTTHLTPSLWKSTTSTLRAFNRKITSITPTEPGEASLSSQDERPVAPKHRRLASDSNLPHGWEILGYDGESYTYRTDTGKTLRTRPGNRYGPYINLD